ncbi:frataxin-like protein [Buchnera aphidicola (Schlechtendalia chinensis)]|uniref:Iron-sulfur cluster assembly protein CyaY n=1 Tax=Buchnera aphidicola subsp. Schlechtendalia chinensis TaxID=118110 RepID=A0A172WE63_BUCSC|nr:iron donor protein CyaY [Buchnera aphidicola]ANF17280.1 frataxin-like protein [Buchnera aphidicola (Schlechtendalia chinensis)]
MKHNHDYNKLANKLFKAIEEKIDSYKGKTDIDCYRHSNVITITFDNKHKIIINQQEPLSQIWLATVRSGYHFEYIEKEWICNRTKKKFWNVLEQLVSNQTKENVKF